MERLTYQDKDGGVFCPWERNSVNGSYDIWDEDGLIQQINRLAAYEDTGLEPGEIADAVTAAKLMAKSKIVSCFGVDADHIRELVQAEQDGRLVVLPCIPGSDIYYLNNVDHEIVPMVLLGFDILPTVVMAQTSYGQSIPVSQFGENVFLTREEAEAALAGKGGEG